VPRARCCRHAPAGTRRPTARRTAPVRGSPEPRRCRVVLGPDNRTSGPDVPTTRPPARGRSAGVRQAAWCRAPGRSVHDSPIARAPRKPGRAEVPTADATRGRSTADPYRTDRVPDRSCQQRFRAEWDLTFQAVRGEQPTRVVLHLERFPVTNVVGDQQITSLVLEFDPPIVEHGTLLVTGLRRETNDELPRSAFPDQL